MAPQKGIFSESALIMARLAYNVGDVIGLEKRRLWIESEIDTLEEKISKIESDNQRIFDVQHAYAERMARIGAAQKGDWSVHGGIASAIGGTGAGVMAASQIMAENAQIDARVNNSIKTSFLQAMDCLTSTYDLEEEREKLCDELEALDDKVAFEQDNSLFEYLKIKAKVVDARAYSLADGNIDPTELYFDITNCYKSDMTQKAKLVIDGTLRVKIYSDNTLMDDMYVALPKYGIPCDSAHVTFTAVSNKYVINNNYRLEISPNNLWLMEI